MPRSPSTPPKRREEGGIDTLEDRMTRSQAAPETPPAVEKAKDPFEGLVPGRIVYFYPAAHQARHASPGPWPGIVTLVGDGGVVTLNLMLPAPTLIGTDPVARVEKVPYSTEKAEGCWSWPDRTS